MRLDTSTGPGYMNWYQSFGYPLVDKLPKPKDNPLPKHITHKEPYILIRMSSSLTPEQVVEQVLIERAEMEAQVKYLQTQLSQLLKEKRRWN